MKPEYGVLIYINTADISPHKDNPRKDLGDLRELAESIKVNGILQNLTVVPIYGELTHEFNGQYTVVIGHRRLAAAKLAGIETVPCIVSDMTGMQQIRTMLTENMQRTDLTVYEQAQGFQMMLDLGDTVDQIAERAGFSKSTVRRRVKLLELDKDKFKKAEKRGATLMDYAELEKIENLDLRNEVLDTIGTANFKERLKRALDSEELVRRMAELETELSTFAVKIEKSGYIGEIQFSMDYVRNFGYWTKKSDGVEKPEDAGTVRYFYRVSKDQIDLYKEHQEREETEEDRQRKEARAESERVKAELQAITNRHYELRYDFIRDFTGAKKHIVNICKVACDALIGDGTYSKNIVSPELLDKLLGIDIEDEMEYSELKAMVEEKTEQKPEYTLLTIAYSILDDGSGKFWNWSWNNDAQKYEYHYDYDEDLDRLYDLLTELGYEMSDEEKAIRNGTHELFVKKAQDGVDDEPEEEDDIEQEDE